MSETFNWPWKYISKATPRDRRILLGYRTPLAVSRAMGVKPPGGIKPHIWVAIGWWDAQVGKERPVGFWTNELVDSIGITALRQNPPVVWMELPTVELTAKDLEVGNGKSGESAGVPDRKVMSKAEGGAGVA